MNRDWALGAPTFTCEVDRSFSGSAPDCAAPCEEYPDLGPGYIVSGVDLKHGAGRTLLCAIGYFPAAGGSPELVVCDRGAWGVQGLQCEIFDCGEFPVLSDAYTVKGSGTAFGSTRSLLCSDGYVSWATDKVYK